MLRSEGVLKAPSTTARVVLSTGVQACALKAHGVSEKVSLRMPLTSCRVKESGLPKLSMPPRPRSDDVDRKPML